MFKNYPSILVIDKFYGRLEDLFLNRKNLILILDERFIIDEKRQK